MSVTLVISPRLVSQCDNNVSFDGDSSVSHIWSVTLLKSGLVRMNSRWFG